MSNNDSQRSKRGLKVLLSVPMDRTFEKKTSVEALNDTGLGYLEAACRRAKADVTLLSWNIDLDKKAFRQKLLELQPDVVGFKVFTTMFRESYNSLRCVRDTLSDAITIIGGPHPSTSRPEDLFAEFEGLIDFAMAGDGEQGIIELLDQIRTADGKPKGQGLSKIPGLIYRNEDKICFNKPCFDVELDTLAPMDWSLQQPAWFGTSHGLDKTGIGALISDSRGCPAKCGFCLSGNINGPKPRHRSLEMLCAEIEELIHRYGVSVLVFTGNVFMSDVDYVKELCERIIRLDTPVKWSCTGSAYARNLKDPKLLNLMRRAGCDLIYFGLESGNPDVRKRLCQPVCLDECTEIVNLTAKAGIRPDCYFMFGFPDETIHEMNDTIKYAFSLPCFSTAFVICLPLPGTSSYKAVIEQQGIKRIDWSKYDFSNPNLLPCKASPGQVHRKLFETKVLKRSRLARQLYRLIR